MFFIVTAASAFEAVTQISVSPIMRFDELVERIISGNFGWVRVYGMAGIHPVLCETIIDVRDLTRRARLLKLLRRFKYEGQN